MTRKLHCLYRTLFALLLTGVSLNTMAQVPTEAEAHKDSVSFDSLHPDTMQLPIIIPQDTVLRIKNLNPYFTLHVDSVLQYPLEINKNPSDYYWFLRNSPVGLRINKDNGILNCKVEKSFFFSGKLKYDQEYKVAVGVQSLSNPKERVDTFFTIVFYNTDIIPSRVKPSVSGTLVIDEGQTVNFKVQCETGSFPIENITFFSNTPLINYSVIRECNQDFTWTPDFDFVKETDSSRVKVVLLSFIGANRFMLKDTAVVKIIVRDALNYPIALQEYGQIAKNINTYILQLKYTFLQLDRRVRKVKNTRTSFDITGSTTALTGSILNSAGSDAAQKTGKILPSVGVSLVPVKEAVAPPKTFDQNQASLIRSSIKRLEYRLRDNSLSGERDANIVAKTNKLKEELVQTQVQLIDIPIEITNNMTEEELNQYFNSPKVSKKYRLKR
ncbi:MAG: hypothetical protein JNL51_02685 [Chitinophagaceae bacterium]|nr:hypothetical protein [Chitinophagaceae bacterium]